MPAPIWPNRAPPIPHVFRSSNFDVLPAITAPASEHADEFAHFIKDGRAVAAEIVKESGAQPQ
jgi:hypothetical protein